MAERQPLISYVPDYTDLRLEVVPDGAGVSLRFWVVRDGDADAFAIKLSPTEAVDAARELRDAAGRAVDRALATKSPPALVPQTADGAAPAAAPATAPATPSAPALTKDVARQVGYTGNSCGRCGSLAMVNTGTCQTCQSCGSTSGCS